MMLNILPKDALIRWTARRKSEMVMHIRSGIVSIEEAEKRYALSEDELKQWQVAIMLRDVDRLKSTKIQQYRGRKP